MLVIWFITALSAMELYWLLRQWQSGRASAQFVLALVPMALLLWTVPVPITVLQLIAGFGRVAEKGEGGIAEIGPLCVGIVSGLRFGSLACLAVLVAAAALQVLYTRGDAAEPSPEPVSSLRKGAMIVGPMLLVVAVNGLSYLAQGVSSLVMRLGLTDPAAITSEAIADASDTISSLSILATLGGVLLTLVLVASTIMLMVAARSRTSIESAGRYSWVIFGTVCVSAIWAAISLTRDLSAYQLALQP